MRKHWIDNLRWVTVLLVLFYHVIYFYNNKGVFGGIGGFGEYPQCPQARGNCWFPAPSACSFSIGWSGISTPSWPKGKACSREFPGW